MFDIKVERIINKPIEAVFDLLADHEGYAKFKGVKAAKVIEPGQTEKNGLGALRYINLGAVNFDERITHFDRPNRLDYLIERSSPLPFKHQLGSITLSEQQGATKVTWVSQGAIGIPLLGKLFLDKIFEKQGTIGFSSLLKQIEAA